MPKPDVLNYGLIEKHVSLNKTAESLIRAGIDVLVAKNAHY